MRNIILLQSKQIKVFIMTLILFCCGVLFQNTAWSESNIATATDETDTIVAGKIIQKQQNQATPSKSGEQPASSVAASPKVSNDMADGESIRGLPTLNQPVIDQANILSEAEKQQLNQKILSLYQQGKAQIGVVIVPTTGQEDIFDYALRVGEQWQLGSSKRDNGLLIAVAVNDRRIQILTGYGLEGVLPDIVASRIIRNQITPYFKQAQYAQGLNAGLDEIGRILNLDPEVAQQAAQDLKERQHQAAEEQQAKQTTLTMALFILVAGIVGSFIVGRPLSASTAGVAAAVAGFVNGAGLVTSLLLGFGVFFLLITSIAQLILQAILSGSGGGGGRGGGFGGGGGGYGGGGGRFGGGGASGSW
ncbi:MULTISPECIES: TPM domain-containing protein [Acinetobacter]|uniref:TPM domain-containing protein n=1 Tax=Acinetobacter TaxID=469 RepID=UPI00125ECDCF|nr:MULTISPECIES: TPM domain-containing protein [Acinetobacter]MBI0423375.1 TPM domain-containing protein [Acinetobacter sp. ACIN00229]